MAPRYRRLSCGFDEQLRFRVAGVLPGRPSQSYGLVRRPRLQRSPRCSSAVMQWLRNRGSWRVVLKADNMGGGIRGNEDVEKALATHRRARPERVSSATDGHEGSMSTVTARSEARTTNIAGAPPWAIAVVDSGVAAGLAVGSGINLSGDGDAADTADPCGHGTAVASTILDIAPGTALVSVKVTDRRGVLRDRDRLADAFAWIAEQRARQAIGIVCVALGDQSCLASDAAFRGSPLQQRIAALRAAGVLTLAPAGNWRRLNGEHREGMVWPAIVREVVSVGAVERTPAGLRVSATSQRLRMSGETACGTTLFSAAAPPGETSGATAALAGCLARLAQVRPGPAAGILADMVPQLMQPARDDDGGDWPALMPDDLPALT